MAKRNIIVIGASAGGFPALRRLVAGLPADLDASVFIVWHLSPETAGILPDVLNKEHTLVAGNALDGELILPRRIYVAPPDRHLLLERTRIRVSRGPQENRFRPAIDALFRSAALSYGPRVIGIILSGALQDGTVGLGAIKKMGGLAIVQDPDEAEVSSMPQSALDSVDIDYSAPISAISTLVTRLSQQNVGEQLSGFGLGTELLWFENALALGFAEGGHTLFSQGRLSPFVCRSCQRVLMTVQLNERIEFRCEAGHVFNAHGVLGKVGGQVEAHLWDCVRASQEFTLLLNNLGDQYASSNEPNLAASLFKNATDSEHYTSAILAALDIPALKALRRERQLR